MSCLGWNMGVVPYRVVMTASSCHHPKQTILSPTKCHQTGVKISHRSVAWPVTTGHKNQIWSNQPQLSPSSPSWKVCWWLSPHFKYWAFLAGVRMISIDRTWPCVCVSCVSCVLCLCVVCGLRRTSETERRGGGEMRRIRGEKKKKKEGGKEQQQQHPNFTFNMTISYCYDHLS